MDEKNRKEILNYIDKIEQYAKANPWLMDELRRRFRDNTKTGSIINIEKYLGLDYNIDSANSNIDYSFVSDTITLEQLISDNREMMRYRYGVRSHKIDFDEFCRFAHLQVESLVNYYYKVTCDDFISAKNKILENNQNAKISDEYPQIESVAFAYKIKACITELFPPMQKGGWFSKDGQFVFDNLSHVKEVRNTQSHRGKQNNYRIFIVNYQKKAKEFGLPWNEQRQNFDWKLLMQNEQQQEIYDLIFKTEQTQYVFCLWYLNKPFDDVIKAINQLTQKMNLFIKEIR